MGVLLRTGTTKFAHLQFQNAGKQKQIYGGFSWGSPGGDRGRSEAADYLFPAQKLNWLRVK